jgi:hypothetical protein
MDAQYEMEKLVAKQHMIVQLMHAFTELMLLLIKHSS